MDSTSILPYLTSQGPVVVMIAIALWWVLRRMDRQETKNEKMEIERNKREEKATEKCEEANADLLARVRQLEDEMRNENKIERTKQLEWIHRITRAVEVMAEKMPIDASFSGKHPAIKEI